MKRDVPVLKRNAQSGFEPRPQQLRPYAPSYQLDYGRNSDITNKVSYLNLKLKVSKNGVQAAKATVMLQGCWRLRRKISDTAGWQVYCACALLWLPTGQNEPWLGQNGTPAACDFPRPSGTQSPAVAEIEPLGDHTPASSLCFTAEPAA